ncbi:unnamed protein product [Pocillopora meandrina]|uniref:Formin GTPase-binding domain-containing protein n=1 Tax=Pocillopora meandrina TaxID=46732 RepID=A0AAU9WU73_9CNID|nr:unnamed protein product [Pocillopora meandrina]
MTKFSDAFLQLECVRCIKAVLNNITGLEFMTSDTSLAKQLLNVEIKDNADGRGEELNIDLQKLNEVEPELFIKFLRIPTLKTYASLIQKLEKSSKKWMTDFLEQGGLTTLFSVLEKLCERGLAKFSDAFLQLECVRCIKAVLNNVTGLEYMTTDPSLTKQLANHQGQFSNVEPELCVSLLRVPSLKNFSALHPKLAKCSAQWMTEFLEQEAWKC